MVGVINLLKPTGLTSSDCVGRVKWLLRRHYNDKSIKVGHLGTLDPLGSGVLPIVYGKATRLFEYCLRDNKIYRSTFTIGLTTDTLDSEGKVTACGGKIPTIAELQAVLPQFIGKIMQVPPQYSSVSVGGVRGYKAARRGLELEIEAREVIINKTDILSYNNGILELDVDCQGGVYIRSLCRDIADNLDTLAYMSSIIRLDNKGLKIEDTVTIEELADNIEAALLPVDCLIGDISEQRLDDRAAFNLLNGVPVAPLGIEGDYKMYIDEHLYGICRDGEDCIQTVIRLWDR